ncbi:hypothetical protein B8A40_01080 [Dolosigranulum pigrum]|uniref:GA-like domain-containing protein n=1 Tax=Dolosigranulum pigrum TaxID=29394 RepID=UPI000DC226D0|nr:YSIRK-type signal peptide-containing protein [Dolosigranulum pigrum]RAN59775.1 hypothetical protein B8A40_01080 [Dolosigranulum pigrum]
MVGKNNKKLLMEMGANKFKRYTLKKLSIGVASVSIGIGLMFGATEQVSAQAEAGTVIEHDEPVNQDITPQSEQQEPEIDHVLEAKRQEVNAYLVSSNLQHNRDQFKAQIDQATSVSELVNIENQINADIAEQVEETEKNNQQSEEQEQKPQDTQVSDEKQSEELEKKRKAVKDELGKSEIVIWDEYLALLNKINEATSIEELDAISAEIRGDKAPEKQDEKEQEADNTIEQTTPATPQQPQVDVQQDTSKPEVEYTLDQVRHFFNQEEIAKIEAGQMTIKQALQKALGTQPDIKTNQNHHEENVLAAGVENLDNKQEEQTGKRRTRRNTGNVDLNRQFNRDDTFMHIFDYLDDLKNKKYLTEEETVIFKRGALRRFANNGDPDLRNDRADARKWETFLRSGQTSHLSRGAENQLKQKLSVRSGDISKLNEIIKKVQQFIKNRQGTNEHLIVDGTDSTNKQTRHELSPDLGNINISQGKTNSHQVTMELKKENPADWNNREYGYDIYTVQVNKKLADKINSVTYRDTAGTKGRLVTKNLNNGYVQYIYKRDYGYDKGSTTPNGNLGKAVEFTFNLKNMLDSDDQLSSYYYNDTIKPQMWPGGGKDHLLQHSFIQYKNEQEHLLSIYNKVVELKGQSKITELREKIKNFSNIYNNLKEDPETDKKIINPDTHRKLDKIKKDIDSHYSSTLELLSNLPNFYKNNKQRTTKKDELLEDLQGRVGNHQYNGLKGRIDALPGYDVNDRNDNSIIDETDVKNAENKVNEIKRKHSELQEKIEKAKKQNRINNHNELINQYESLKASIQEAKNLISQIPEFDDVYQDGQSFNQKRQGLTNSLPNLSELNLPVAPPTQKVELSNLDGLSREQKEQVKDNLKANNPELDLSKVTVAADGTVTVQWDEHNSVTVDKSETVELKVNKDALQQAIEKTRKTTNSEFYNKLEELDPNLKSEYDKAKQQAEITFNNNKASQTEVNKATNKLNELESKISEREQIEVTKKFNQAKAKVEEAKQAVQTAQAKKEEIERDGVVNPSEVAELNALNDAVTKAKNEANTAVNALPDGAANGEDTKASLQDELGGINLVDVPAVTDENSNGIADDAEWENGQGLINEKPEFPAEELERLLQVERDKAADYIASLPNLDASKVNEFKAAIQSAQTVPAIEEIIQAAETLNAKLAQTTPESGNGVRN